MALKKGEKCDLARKGIFCEKCGAVSFGLKTKPAVLFAGRKAWGREGL